MQQKYVDSSDLMSDLAVRLDRIKKLSTIGNILTAEEKDLFEAFNLQLIELQKQGIRRLHDQGHHYVRIADKMGVDANSVLRLGQITL